MSDERDRILALIEAHRLKAAASEYDRSVCITAVSRARDQIMLIDETLPAEPFLAEARQRIGSMIETYHDPDGDHTSGRSVLVPILDELYREA